MAKKKNNGKTDNRKTDANKNITKNSSGTNASQIILDDELPASMFYTFLFEQYDPLDRDILSEHREALTREKSNPAKIKKRIKALADDMTKAADMLYEPMHQREDQLRFLNRSVI